jgi:hypothetical protein
MKKLQLFLVTLVGAIGLFTVLGASSAKVAAALPSDAVPGPTFPRGGNSMLFITQFNDGRNLETPRSNMRIFYDMTSSYYRNNNTFTVNVDVICRAGLGDPGGGMTLTGNSERSWNWSSRCAGVGVSDTPNGAALTQTVTKSQLNKTQTNIYGHYAFADLTLKVNNDNAAVGAIVRAPGSYVTFRELIDDNPAPFGNSDNYTGHGTGAQEGPWTFGGDPSTNNAYAILPKTGYEDYKFTFATNCAYTGAAPYDTYIRWYDADWNVLQPHGSEDYYLSLVDTDNGNTPVRTVGANSKLLDHYNGNLGGNDSYRELHVALIPHHKYMWTWHNVYENNGVQFWIPFSEMGAVSTCEGGPPTGNIGAIDADCAYINGWAQDADDDGALQYRLRITAADGSSHTFTDTANTNDYRAGHGFHAVVPGLAGYFGNGSKDVTITLDAKGIDADGVVDSNYTNNLDSRTLKRQCGVTSKAELGICSAKVHFDITNGARVQVFALKENYDTAHPFADASSDMVKEIVENGSGASDSIDLTDDVGWHYLQSNRGFWVLVRPVNASSSSASNYPSGTGRDDGTGAAYRSVHMGDCFNVSCDFSIVAAPGSAEAGWPVGAIKAGLAYTAKVHLQNNSPSWLGVPTTVPANFDEINHTYPLSISDFSGSPIGASGNHRVVGFALGSVPIKDYYFDIPFTAPSTVAVTTLKGYPDFWGKFRIGNDCAPANVSTYQEFNITPSAPSNPVADAENPDTITWDTHGERDLGPYDINATANSWLNRNPVDGSAPVTLQTVNEPSKLYGSQSFTHTYSDTIDGRGYGTGTWQPGDKYCSYINITPGHGWAGPPAAAGSPQNLLSTTTTTSTDDSCGYVSNRPYLRAYGADVSAGGGFGSACTSSGGIEAFTRPLAELSTRAGSGSQLAAFATADINGFTTAIMLNTNPLLFSFANNRNNTGAVGGDVNRPHLGGGFGAVTDRCATDFYSDAQLPITDSRRLTDARTTLNIPGDTPSGKQTVSKQGTGTGTLTLNGGNFSGQHALFVEGNVYITSNIVYLGSSNPVWADLNSISNFSLVVKGNIYISKDVTELDGLYVAQPRDVAGGHNNDPATGKIYTCTDAGGARFADSQLWSQCQNQLRIHGSFVASQVRFLRSVNTLIDSVAKEPVVSSKAAEIFQVSPDMYLSQPVFRSRGINPNGQTGQYDYIANLPPIL